MTKSFHAEQIPQRCDGSTKDPRHLGRAQPAGLALQRVQFLSRGVTVFHAGNIEAAACLHKR
jgi:hypothetical protein